MIDWIDSDTFELGGQRFVLEVGTQLATRRSTRDLFVLGKERRMVERFARQNSSGDVQRILELGILQGGSIALEYEVCRPDRLVAIDVNPEPVPALEAFIADRDLGEAIHLYYGVDQADQDALARIIEAEFGDATLDLVIDDASHLYEPARASFEMLFPHLRAGGRYVIEDWDWAHYPGDQWQTNGGPYPDHPALTNLVIEILMVAGTRPDVVSEVTVARSLAEVIRGSVQLEAPVKLPELYLNRGLPFRALL